MDLVANSTPIVGLDYCENSLLENLERRLVLPTPESASGKVVTSNDNQFKQKVELVADYRFTHYY